MTISLEQLPKEVIHRIAGFLPQQAKVNWMYTSFHFYQLVQPALYEKIMITPAALSPSLSSYRDARYTVIGYLSTPMATEELNTRVFNSRQQVFLQSLQVNSDLCKMINEVVVYDFKNDRNRHQVFDIVIEGLLEFLQANCTSISEIAALNTLSGDVIVPSLQNVYIQQLSSFPQILDYNIKELFLFSDGIKLNPFELNSDHLQKLFSNIETLVFQDELSQVSVLKYLLSNPNWSYSFKNIKLIHYHSSTETTLECNKYAEDIWNFVDHAKLKRLELDIGCDELVCRCFDEFMSSLKLKELNLSSLSIVQKTTQRDHNYSEKFDFDITQLLKSIPNIKNLNTLSIRHCYPTDFNCVGGFEGNYLHRIEMYKNVIPLLTSLETLVAPTFMQSVACYEQLMSDLLWNNTCLCTECKDYTDIFDAYVQNHQYFSDYGGKFVDMFTSFLFGNVGKTMGERIVDHCDMFIYRYPKLVKYWDFHRLDAEIVHLNDSIECGIDATAFNPLAVVVDHFLKDYVKVIKELQPCIKHVMMSGFYYDLQHDWMSE